MPSSTARPMTATDSDSPVVGPKFRQPRQSGLIFSPVRPNGT